MSGVVAEVLGSMLDVFDGSRKVGGLVMRNKMFQVMIFISVSDFRTTAATHGRQQQKRKHDKGLYLIHHYRFHNKEISVLAA
jgi:hypothetical protein